jgi:putative membrane protein
MQKNKVLKQLLAVSTVAAMFGAFPAHAQTSSSATPSTQDMNKSKTGTTNMDGKTGTSAAGTSSQGSAATGSSGTQGSDAASGASGTSAQGMSGQTSTGAAASGQAAASGSAKLSKADQKAVMDMARANMAEIEAGKLALSKSQDEQVKSFAQQMVDDHTKALTDVQTLAQEKGVTLPTEPDAKHKAMAAKLEKLSGDAFNKEYMKQAGVADHKKVLSMLKKYHTSAKDPDVKVVAGKMLPTVEQHLKAAQSVAGAKNGMSGK